MGILTRRLLVVIVVMTIAASVVPAAAADRPLTVIHSQNLTVVGQPSAKTLRGIALQLEQFRAVVGGLISNAQRPLPVPTTVYVFATHKDLEPFIPLYNGKPASLGGYFFHDDYANTIALQLEGFDEGAQIVFHEYTHLLVHNAARSLPLWLDEGLAEYYSTYRLENDAHRANIGLAIARHVLLLRERFVPLAYLIRVDHASPLYNERDRQSIFYAEAWALTHYLMTAAPNGAQSINAYATAVAKGSAPDAAFLQAFGKTPEAFEKDLHVYVRGLTFLSRIFTLNERLQVNAPDAGQSLTIADSTALLGDLQRRAGRIDEAEARLNGAGEAGNSARLLLARAQLLLDRKRLDDAWPLFERAAAVAPDDFSTQFGYGVALLLAENPGAGGGPAVTHARDALLKATAANPASSDAFAWLSYAEMLTEGRLKEAATAIRRAIELAPGRLDYLLRYADIFMLAGGLGDARTLLTDVSKITTDQRAAEMAKRRLAVLDEQEARMRAAVEQARQAAERRATLLAERRAAEERTRSDDSPRDSASAVRVDPDRTLEPDAARPRLRVVQRGEERAYGDLVELECGASEVRAILRVGSRLIVATARRMNDITLTSFLPDSAAVACGKRASPDAVYLTWRSAPHRAEGAATVVGQAVAIEFVPRGYTP